jgi:hypothetical protein
MSVLSPAAQAAWTAYETADCDPYFVDPRKAGLAAALRAAADQGKAMEIPFSVVTDWEKVKGSCASFYAAAEWGYYQALREQRAIADELEGHA